MSSANMLPYISNADVNRLITWDKLMPELHASLLAYYDGPSSVNGVIQPLRSRMNIPHHDAELLLMPAFMAEKDTLAVKLLTIYPNNELRDLATHSGIIILFDGATGIPKALMDAAAITELRTAAVSALVTKHLGYKNCKRIAVLGSGRQGNSHARALHHVIPSAEIRVWSRKGENAAKLVTELRDDDITANCFDLIEDCVANCEVIATCTSSSTPILKKEWIDNQTHINAVGAPNPNLRELDADLMKSAKVFVDSVESAMAEAGDVILSGISDIQNLQDLLRKKQAPFTSGVTVFKNLGLAVEDAATAELVFKLFNEDKNEE